MPRSDSLSLQEGKVRFEAAAECSRHPLRAQQRALCFTQPLEYSLKHRKSVLIVERNHVRERNQSLVHVGRTVIPYADRERL